MGGPQVFNLHQDSFLGTIVFFPFQVKIAIISS